VDHLTPSLLDLLAPFRGCFRQEAFVNFVAVVEAWLLCLGPRTLSEVWQFCLLNRWRHDCTIYDLFSRARWDWDELGKALLGLLLAHFAPCGTVWLAVDDTLCHKRGKRVAYGGIFLNPVLSSRSRKVFRYAVNYVVLALVVEPPFRPDRTFALPLLWRAFRKKGEAGYRKKTELAREPAWLVALALPDRRVCLIGDSAFIYQRQRAARAAGEPGGDRAAAAEGGPVRRGGAAAPGRLGRPRKKGERLPSPKAMLELPEELVAENQRFDLPGGPKRLRVQVLCGVLWYTGCKQEPVAVVLLRDPRGSWRDEALLCTDVRMAVAEVVSGYCRRWSIETNQPHHPSSERWCAPAVLPYHQCQSAA
jgi:hypothetical protein